MPDPISRTGSAGEPIPAPTAADNQRQKARLTKATQDFEAVFLGMMLKQMRKSIAGSNALFGNSPEAKLYQDMMDDTLAQKMSQSGTFGLAKAMFKSMARNLPADSPDGDNKALDLQK